jgi:hypothetical protein
MVGHQQTTKRLDPAALRENTRGRCRQVGCALLLRMRNDTLSTVNSPEHKVRRCLLACLTLGLVGCTVVVGDGEQCQKNEDCAAAGFATWLCRDRVCVPGGGDWSCLGQIDEPQSDKKVILGLEWVDFLNRTQRISDITIRVCSQIDFECLSPLDGIARELEEGLWQFELSADFFGYIEVTGPNVIPTIVMLNPYTHQVLPAPLELTVPLGSPLALSTVTRAIGVTTDDELGHVMMTARDCKGQLAAGIAGSIGESQGTPFTIRHPFIPATDELETDRTGFWGTLNVKPGFYTVQGTFGMKGPPVGSLAIIVRKGHITELFLSHSP